MIRIISGLRYNTETAISVAHWSNGLSYSDFRNCSEELFITKKGNWFINFEGGPASQYAVHSGNYSSSHSGIKPLTSNEAFTWLQEHEETLAIEKYFTSEVDDA